jgi:hypothetical protein
MTGDNYRIIFPYETAVYHSILNVLFTSDCE